MSQELTCACGNPVWIISARLCKQCYNREASRRHRSGESRCHLHLPLDAATGAILEPEIDHFDVLLDAGVGTVVMRKFERLAAGVRPCALCDKMTRCRAGSTICIPCEKRLAWTGGLRMASRRARNFPNAAELRYMTHGG